MKLKNVQAYPIKDVPDYLVEECKDLGIKIISELLPYLESNNPNIMLGAIAFVHASIIKTIISDKPEELQKAVKLAAIGLIKNVECLANLKIMEDDK